MWNSDKKMKGKADHDILTISKMKKSQSNMNIRFIFCPPEKGPGSLIQGMKLIAFKAAGKGEMCFSRSSASSPPQALH